MDIKVDVVAINTLDDFGARVDVTEVGHRFELHGMGYRPCIFEGGRIGKHILVAGSWVYRFNAGRKLHKFQRFSDAWIRAWVIGKRKIRIAETARKLCAHFGWMSSGENPILSEISILGRIE